MGEDTAPARHALTCTVPFDLTGSPALSVPFGASSEGLPIGVQIVGRHYERPPSCGPELRWRNCTALAAPPRRCSAGFP